MFFETFLDLLVLLQLANQMAQLEVKLSLFLKRLLVGFSRLLGHCLLRFPGHVKFGPGWLELLIKLLFKHQFTLADH